MSRLSRRATAVAWLLAALLAPACAAPPNTEIADAQAALKAADDAGAEQFAPVDYEAAAEAYRLANEAVMQGDYRLALNRALESRERAQIAEREAAAARERLRDEVQQMMAGVVTLLARAGSRIDDAERARVPNKVIRDARQTLAQLNQDVQEAGAVLKEDDYGSAQPVLGAVQTRLEELIASLDTAITTQSQKRPR